MSVDGCKSVGCPSLRGFRLIESIVKVKWLDNDRGQHQRVVRPKRCLLRESWLHSKFISNPLEKKKIAQSNSWTDTERKKSCQMLIAHFWRVKLKNNNKTKYNTIIFALLEVVDIFTIFTSTVKHLVYPPKILHQ